MHLQIKKTLTIIPQNSYFSHPKKLTVLLHTSPPIYDPFFYWRCKANDDLIIQPSPYLHTRPVNHGPPIREYPFPFDLSIC